MRGHVYRHVRSIHVPPEMCTAMSIAVLVPEIVVSCSKLDRRTGRTGAHWPNVHGRPRAVLRAYMKRTVKHSMPHSSARAIVVATDDTVAQTTAHASAHALNPSSNEATALAVPNPNFFFGAKHRTWAPSSCNATSACGAVLQWRFTFTHRLAITLDSVLSLDGRSLVWTAMP